jgi:hypothetical protein
MARMDWVVQAIPTYCRYTAAFATGNVVHAGFSDFRRACRGPVIAAALQTR